MPRPFLSARDRTITGVVAGGPAHQSAIIAESDQIVAVNGKPVNEKVQCQNESIALVGTKNGGGD